MSPLTCDACNGLGWVRGPGFVDGSSWPATCTVCSGVGHHQLASLARTLRVPRTDLYRVLRLEAGAIVAPRVLRAVVRRFGGRIEGLASPRRRARRAGAAA